MAEFTHLRILLLRLSNSCNGVLTITLQRPIMRKIFLVSLFHLCTYSSVALASQSIVIDFGILTERCRQAVETSSEFDASGLQLAKVPDSNLRNRGIQIQQSAFGNTASHLITVLTTWTARDGTVRNLCQVHLKSDSSPLKPSDQALIIRDFLITQNSLVAKGTHIRDRELPHLPPLINAGFLARSKTPNGCVAGTSLTLHPDGSILSAGTGERAIEPCDN